MKVLVNEREIEEIRFSKIIGIGNEGYCYLPANDNLIVKLFFDNYKEKVKHIYFSELNCSQIAFPIDVLYNSSENIIGYTMNYLSGVKFVNGFKDDLLLSDLKKAYLNIRNIILNLKNVYMDDNCLENMLYDYINNKIKIIDTSRWYENKDGQLESINELNWQMMTALIRNIDFKRYKLNHEKGLLDIYLTYQYSEHLLSVFMDFLSELELVVSEYKGKKVERIKDLIIK